MNTRVRDSHWHGFDAITLEGEGISATVVPETGGRIVSLYDTENQWEWLLSPEQSHPYRTLEPGADFNTTTPGGWDEMFPTVLAETYPAPGPFQGVQLPDHGEVWTEPWTVETRSGGRIQMSVEGRALPYRLRRSLEINWRAISVVPIRTGQPGQRSIVITSGQLTHSSRASRARRSSCPMRSRKWSTFYRWNGVEEWGPPGTRNTWPEKVDPDGRRYSQDVVGGADLRRGRKFYILPDEPICWAALAGPLAGVSLKMEWDPRVIPYFGVWVDEGVLNAIPSVALEPTTGYYDTLNTAWKNRRVAVLGPRAVRNWELRICLNEITESS